jgi:hypothetical protein
MVGIRGFAGTLRRGCLLASSAEFGGEDEEDEEVDIMVAVEEPGRGAIGIAASTVLLYAGYPSQCLPDRTHLLHWGLVSSHLTLRFLCPRA